jgi:hypothetical protein
MPVKGKSPRQRAIDAAHGSVDIRRQLAVFVEDMRPLCGLTCLTQSAIR